MLQQIYYFIVVGHFFIEDNKLVRSILFLNNYTLYSKIFIIQVGPALVLQQLTSKQRAKT